MLTFSKTKLTFLLVGCGIFLLFVLFSYIVHKDAFLHIDFNTTVRLQDKIPRRVDPYFSWFSTLGNFEVMAVFLALVLLGLRRLWGGIVAIFFFGVFHFIEIFGKVMVDHPPPPQFMLRTKQAVDFPQYHVRLESSYPSGHSGRTIFVSLLLLYLIHELKLPSYIKYGLYAAVIGFDIIMLTSRIYLGEHWTSDVIGGSLLAAGFGFVTLAFLVRDEKKHKHVLPHDS